VAGTAARLFLLVAIPGLTALWVRLSEAHSALLWTEYYAARGPERKGTEEAAKAGRAAARAIDLGAPFPDAATAASLSLDLARALEPQNADAALALVTEVRAALERVQGSAFRGTGLSGFSVEARALEERARPRTRRP
jgi:hypothetical protein